MEQAWTLPRLSVTAQQALQDAAAEDGIAVSDLIEHAVERELQRRARRRTLIARHRRRAVLPPLQARLG
jgi:post-segregation antitoxin (ccd killing protein)